MDNWDNHVAHPESVFFNLIVPTRNRADTLYFCIKSLLSQNYPNFRITVSDNCSTDNTKEIILGFNDSRVRYVSTNQPLSMRENWEFALNQIDDGWVGFIGDDDGLMPDALERVAEVIGKTKVSAVTSSWCRYTWPGGGLLHAEKLILPVTRGVEVRKSDTWRRRVMSGVWRYIELPYIYTGAVVDYRVIKKALNEKSYFFNSMNPDIYSAIAISLLVDEYAFIREPIALRGTSFHSTGASTFKGSGNDAPKQDFMAQNVRALHPLLQDDNFPISTHFFVYECYLQAAFLGGASEAQAATADLGRQLRIVAALSQGTGRRHVKNYCNRIFERSGGKSRGIWQSLWALIVKPLYFLNEFRRVLDSALVDTAPLGVNDVYAASVLARDIQETERNRRFRRVRRIWSTARIYLRPRKGVSSHAG